MSNKHKISVMISEDKLQEKIAEIGAKIRVRKLSLYVFLREAYSSAVNLPRE